MILKAVAPILLLWSSVSSFAQGSKVGSFTGNAKSGRVLYGRNCITCHGPRGDGAD